MLPWKETSVESERLRFIERVTAGEEPVTELCRQSGISRKTGYKLIHRYEAHGEDGLLDRSRAPHYHPNAIPAAVAERIVEAKRTHPTWGPKKLVAWLHDMEPDTPWPAHSTAGGILDRAGLVQRSRRRRRASPWNEPFAHAIVPNDVWFIDFKGWFRTDNGPPFASVGLGSLSPLSAWWIKLGIVPERIEPGHPEQNGRLERLHRTLKAETASPPRANRRRQRRAFDHFRHSYNNERPHEALGQRPPVRLYTPSFRPYPSRLNSPEYGAEVTVRRVRHNGEIKWKGDRVYVSASLRGEPIGLVQQDERTWSIQFGPLLIGVLDDHARRIDKTSVHVLPMSPV